MWVLGLVILVDEIDKNIVRGLDHPAQGGVRRRRLRDRAPPARSRCSSTASSPSPPATSPTGGTAPGPSASTVIGWSAVTRRRRHVGQLPDARRDALGARLRPGHHRAVGRRLHRRLLPARGARQGVLDPADDAVRRHRHRRRPRRRPRRRLRLARRAASSSAIPGLFVAFLVFRHAGAQAGHGRPDGGHRRRLRRARRGRRSPQALRAAASGSSSRDMLVGPPGRHEDDPRHPHDALRPRRRRRPPVHDHRHRRLAAAVLRAPPRLRGGRRRGARSASSPCWAACPACSFGGRVADKYAPRMQGGRLALPAIFLFVGTPCFTASYLFRAPAGATEVDWATAAPAYVLQLLGLFIMTMAIPVCAPGSPTPSRPTSAAPASAPSTSCRWSFGAAAAPFIVGAHLQRLRREPARRLPRRHAAQLHRRR